MSDTNEVRNLKCVLTYDGTKYVGWQKQPNGLSVQSVVEKAIEQLTHQQSPVLAAGRTDSGVHALGQVINFQTASTIPVKQFGKGLTHYLPSDIAVRNIVEVPESFHATYSAKRKRYRYLIWNDARREPFLEKYSWHFAQTLNHEAMHSAAQQLVGTHDFRSFESHFPNKSTSVRTVEEVRVFRQPVWTVWTTESICDEQNLETEPLIVLEIVADGFLYNMVRAIVGTLIPVGRGKWGELDVKRILESQDRSQAGQTAPAQGLFLVHVEY